MEINNYNCNVNIYQNNEPGKTCNYCDEHKPLSQFQKNKSSPDGYRSQCKECTHKKYKNYYDRNKDIIYDKRKESGFKADKAYYNNNRDKVLKYKQDYYIENKEAILQRDKEYRENHKDLITERRKQYYQNIEKLRKETDPVFRLLCNLRTRIGKMTKKNPESKHTVDYLGCSPDFYWKFIKYQLPYEMSDQEFREKYEVDHVTPLASFDLSVEDDKYEAFSWTNCHPLVKKINRSKQDKIIPWLEVMQELRVYKFLKLLQESGEELVHSTV